MKQNKVSLFGLFGVQNLGNEFTLQAMKYNLDKHLPGTLVHCICSNPEDTSRRYDMPSFPISTVAAGAKGGSSPGWKNGFIGKLLRKVFVRIPMETMHFIGALRFVSGSKMLIVPGTGLLIDSTTGPFGFPYRIFKWAVIARLSRSRLMFVSIGAGPIYHPLSKWFIRAALSMADYRSYRDDFSREYLSSIGFDTGNDRVYPDLAFSLPDVAGHDNNAANGDKPVIGVGLFNYYGPGSSLLAGDGEACYREYLEKTAVFILRLIEQGYWVRIIIGDVKYDMDVRKDLLELLEKKGMTQKSGKLVSEPISDPGELVKELVETDIVVSPRFHNIILAIILNKPVLSISYNEKFDALMEGFGMKEYCQQIGKFDVEELMEQLERIVKNSAGLKRSLALKTREYAGSLDEQYSIIFDSFGGGNG